MSTGACLMIVTVLGLVLVALRRDIRIAPARLPIQQPSSGLQIRREQNGVPRDWRRVQRALAVAVILALLLQMVPVSVPSPSEATASLVSKAPAPLNAVAPYLSQAVAPLDALVPPFSNIQPVFADPTVGITITKSASPWVNQVWGGNTEFRCAVTLTNPSGYTITPSSQITDSVPISTTAGGGAPEPGWAYLPSVAFRLDQVTNTTSYAGEFIFYVNTPVPDGTIVTNTTYCFSGTLGITPTRFCETRPVTTEIKAPNFRLTESRAGAPGAVCAGQRLTYTIAISNPGRVGTTRPFTITGMITNPVTIYTNTLSSDATSSGSVITWSITSDERFLDLGGADILTRTFAVSVPASLANGTYLTNTYTIASPEVAPTPGSWSSSGVTVSQATAAFTSTSPVCLGGTMVFTNTSAGATSYQWNFGDGSPITDTVNPTHVYTASRSYTVWLTATGTCGTGVTTGTVTVNPGAIASFTPLSTTICTGQSVTFTNTSTNATAYQWNFGDGSPVTTTISPTHVFTNTGAVPVTRTVTLTATGACGSAVTTGTVTVNPGAVASFTPLSTTICTGQSVTFTNTSTNATAYQWNFGDGSPVTTTISPTHVFTNTGAVPVTRTVTLTATGACGSAVTTGTVTITPLPSVSFTSNSPVILGQTMYFTNTGSTGTYQWNLGDSTSIVTTTNTVTHTYSSTGNYPVWLTTTLGTGCWGTYSATVTVTDVTGCEDVYEPDNDYTTATTVTVPSFTSHNFDDGGDEDWAVFSGTVGMTYTIETLNLATNVDTKLYFYSWNGITLTQLASHDDRGPSDWSSIITWPVTSTGWYYVQVGRFTGGFYGCDATYNLSIIRTGVPCTTTLVIVPDTLAVGNTATMTATVVDCSGSPLAGKVITFSTTSGLGIGNIRPITATTNASGWAISYISSTLAGTKLVTATAPNLVAGTDTVTFTAGPPFTITLIATPNTLPVSNTAVLSATVVDRYTNPVPGLVITFTSSALGSGGISPVTATTNASGQAVSYISSTLTGAKLVTATAPNLVTGTTTVTFTAAPTACEDAYEPDDSRAEARTVTPPNTTHHDFDDAGDVDWIRFQGTAGITYTIETLNLTTGVDTKVNFYSWNGITLTLLASNDDRAPGDRSSLITWVVATDGWYYVEVGRFTGSYYGCDAYYDLRIAGPMAYVYLPIILKDHPPLPPTPVPPTPEPCYPLLERTVTVGNNPRGVALGNGMIYVANYGDGTVSVINETTYSVTKVITGVVGANGVAYDGTHNLVYVTKYDSAQLAVIDASTNTVSQTVGVGNGPHGVAYNPTANKIYVANYISNTVTILNGNTRALIATVAAPGGETEPAHIAVNPVNNKVYVTYHGSGRVGVIDGNSNAMGNPTIDIYNAGPYGIAVDTVRDLVYVATIDTHSIVAIDSKTDTYLGWAAFHKDQDPAQPAPMRVIAVNPNLGSTGHLYATTAAADGGFDRLFAIPKGWYDYFHRPYAIDVGSNPLEGIAVNLSNNRVYVTAGGSNGRLTVLEDGVPPCLWNFDLGFTFTLCRVGIDGDCR